MKIPRNITAQELLKALRPFGYEIIRQKGSHIRIFTSQNGGHSETIPNHNPIKIGTLNHILSNISQHFDISKDELVEKIF